MFMYTLYTLHFTRYTTKYIPGAQLPDISPIVPPLAVPLEVPLRRGRVATAVPRARERSLTRVRQHVPPEVAGIPTRVVAASPRAGKRFLTCVRPHVHHEVAGLRGRVVAAGPRAGKRCEAELLAAALLDRSLVVLAHGYRSA